MRLVEQTTPEHNRKPSSSRSRLLFFALVCLLSLLVVAWWWRGLLMQWALQQFLQRPPFADAVVSGMGFSLDQAHVNSLQLGLQTAAGPLSMRLQDVRASYDLRASNIDTIAVAKAELRFTYQPTPDASEQSATASNRLVVPLQHLTIDNLDLSVDTPQGTIVFNGACELNISSAQAIQVVFQDTSYSLRLDVAPDWHKANVIVAQHAGGTVLQLDYHWRDVQKHAAKLEADASALLKWLSSSGLIPATLKKDMASSELMRAAPGMAAVKLALSAESPDDLANLTGRLLLTRDEDYLATADLALKTATMRLKADAHLDLTTVEIVELFKPWLPEVVNAWRFATGHAMTTLHLEWRPQHALTGSAYLRAYHLGIGFGAIQVEDGFLQLDVKDWAKFSVFMSADVPKLLLGKETTVRDLTLKAHLQNPLLTIERVNLPVFGGVLEVLPATVNIERWPVQLTLGVKDIDLAQLLDSLNYPALSGTGTLNGKLPLSLTPDTFEINGGLLKATVPGVLRYQGPTADDENIAFKALRNMLYHSLQASMDYRPNGEYHIGLRIEGKNPQLLSGHPVAFNLNLSGQLPELLQKGILTGDFNQPVLEQLNGTGHP
ncbi:YdbH domain-containing protein [Methylomonas rapida]|uniref:YdbH domain-containing protein n=1 Tax=Methylomonas rapida TaxID=2963939 RepID=A0ABY7GIJ9_9GAMM|nr:YdbH domain-containing protein [Methylomonas rapida]WAR44734.1 YdbH domain-containing protein [Methylomonas rapida]